MVEIPVAMLALNEIASVDLTPTTSDIKHKPQKYTFAICTPASFWP